MYIIKYLILLSLIYFSWNCKSKNDEDYEKTIYEISIYTGDEEYLISKIDSVTGIIKSGDTKHKIIRGFLYLAVMDVKKAKQDFTEVIKEYPQNSYGYTGLALTNPFNTDSALSNFNTAIKLDKGNSLAFLWRSGVKERGESRLSDLNKAIELKPDCSMYYSWRGEYYDYIDSTDLAIKDFQKSITLDRPYPLSFSLLGIIYEQKGRYLEDLHFYDQLIKNTTNKRYAYESRGQVYYKMKFYNEAIKNYKQAITFKKKRFGTRDTYLYYIISENYSLLNEPDSAFKYLDLTLQADSDYVNYLNNELNFNNIKNTIRFKNLLIKYSKK